jgi:small conductance mechanosensitive channel
VSSVAGLVREVSQSTQQDIIIPGLRIAGIIVGALVLRWLVHRAIARVVTRATTTSLRDRFVERRRVDGDDSATELLRERRRQRAETIGSILRSCATAVIFGVAFVMVLSEVHIDIGPIIASAGVVGVALGFGAQSLVKDFLSGVFMILEDQYGVGDVVDTGSATGTVEEVGLRVTRLRDGQGVVWYVRNGEILRIGNQSQGWSTAIVDVSVAYDENLPAVQELIRSVAADLADDEEWADQILEDPVVAGVESVTGTAMTIRVIIRCRPSEHLGVQRELRSRVKLAFDREGVRVPPPVPPYGPGPSAAGAT